MLRARRRRQISHMTMPEVSLTPLIDTALTLLVIFMVTAPMLQHNIKVDLPQGVSQEVKQQQGIFLTATKEGRFFLNNKQIGHAELAAAMRVLVADQKGMPVHIRADRELAYGEVLALVEEIKRAGAQSVALSIQS